MAADDVRDEAPTPEITGGVVSPYFYPRGTLMTNTSLLVALPQLLVKTANLPSRLMFARGVSQ